MHKKNVEKFSDNTKNRTLAELLRIQNPPKYPDGSKVKLLRIVDLFAGCGGLTLGAFQAANELTIKPEIAFAIDSNPLAMDVYKSNFSHSALRLETGKIEKYSATETFFNLSKFGISLNKEIGKIDILLAGPPCQGNSDLNNSSRRNDPRNELYLAPVLFAEHLRPRFVIIENVPGVIHAKSNVVHRSIDRLSRSGFVCSQMRLDLTSLGLPQSRKRHLLVASREHTKEELDLLFSSLPASPQCVSLWDFISDLEDIQGSSTDIFNKFANASAINKERIDYLFDNEVYDLPNELRPPCHRDRAHSYVSMYGRLKKDLPSQTITSGFGSMGQGRFVHPTRRRTITPHEAARIQGFPDYFSFGENASMTELRKMIGNAVAPALSKFFIEGLLR